MKKIFAILVTAVLMLTILTASVSAIEGGGKTTLSEGSTTKISRGVPEIEVEKTVWNGSAWVDEVRAVVGEEVKFNSTIHNSGSCDLTNIEVTDTLSDSFDFVDATPVPNGTIDNPDGTTTLTWFLPGPLVPCKTKTFFINATVTKCGVDTNTQYAEAEGCGQTVYGEDTATVNVPGVPGIDVTKKVWNETAEAWKDSITANLGDSVRFNSTIENIGTCPELTGADLTDIVVTDTLPKSLEYTSATPEPDEVTHPDGTTVLTWFLSGPLAADNTETFLIDATVIECVDTITNTQNATAECCGQNVSHEAIATVNVEGVAGIEVVKTVWDGTAWVDSITANLNDIVEFNLTVHNNGTCCDLTDIWVVDLLPDSFEYISDKGDTPGPDMVDYSKQGETELVWFFSGPLEPCETRTYMITARVIECGVAENFAMADAWAECIEGEVEDWDTATVTVPGVPGIEVEKTVWNGSAWVDEITATVSDPVEFKSTIHNNGTCCDLTNIEVTDTLSDSFDFVDATPVPNGTVHNPDGTTTLTWFLPGPLEPSNKKTFLINANVTKCGVDTNTQYAEAYGCEDFVFGEDTATVIVPGEPGIEVNKTVKNETGAWVNGITAKLGDNVTFKSTIHNNGTCCDLTNINVTDTLSPSLEYISAIPEPDGVIYKPDGTTVLTWFLADPLAPCETETFLIDATVIGCGEDTNTQNATAVGCGQKVSDEATATVDVPSKPSIDVEKTVWNGTAWVKAITAKLNDTVQFKATIHNDGTCCDLTDIVVRDTLSGSLEYTSAIPMPEVVTYPDGTTLLNWSLAGPLAPCETETFLINATVIGCGVDTNTLNATTDYGGESVSDEDTATVNVPSEPGMKVEKTVWNGTAWVKEITANLNDIVKFNSTIYNTGAACCPLTNITVWDILSDSLEYLNATPVPDKVITYPNGTTKITWYPDVFAPCRPVPPATSKEFIINATVTECGGVDTNTQYVEAVSCGEVLSEQDTATVNVPGVPGIEVNKTIWNETAEAWEDRIKANVSDTVRFRCEIHNNGTCCPLTDIVVTDILSDSLEYADNATVDDAPWEPTIVNPNEFKWEFPDLVLEPCETITIEFDTHVVKCGVDTNTQKATAVGCGKTVSDEDTATVNVTGEVKRGIEVEKTVWDGNAWVDKINASIGDTVKFNSTVHNNGTCCNLTNINVTDTLSDSFEYISAIPVPNGVTHNLDGTTTLIWFFSGPLVPCETITLLIDAHVTKYGEASNKQNATADACGTWVSDEDYAYVSAILKPDLVITDEWLCWPDNCTICYNVTNIGEGTAPACHNTTLYVDGVAVAHDHVPVDLAPGESYSGCFDDYIWAYTPPSDNITVCADNNETLDELDEDNNCLTNIWMCGDVNGDGEVTMSDVRKVFNRYLDPSYPLDLPWAADVYCDGEVTMSDVRKVFNRYLDPEYELNCCCKVVE